MFIIFSAIICNAKKKKNTWRDGLFKNYAILNYINQSNKRRMY